MLDKNNEYQNQIVIYTGLVAVVAMGLWLRLRFIHTVQLFPDEFVTLYAIRMIVEKGVPVMPSGLFYEHGLLFSYLASPATWLGPARLMVRYASLLFGLLTLGLTFFIGRRWFSPAVGLMAAAGLAIAPTAVHWSGRARMYSLLQLLVLLTLWFAYKGIRRDSARWRWIAIGIYLAALLTHFAAVALAPALIGATIFLFWIKTAYPSTLPSFYPSNTPISFKRSDAPNLPISQNFLKSLLRLWPETLAFIVVVAVGFLVKRLGQPKGIDKLDASDSLAGIAQVFAIYSDFSLDVAASWQTINPFYLNQPAQLFLPFALIAAGYSLFTVFRRALIQPQTLARVESGRNRGSVASSNPNLQSPISQSPLSEATLPIFYLTLILLITTLVMILFVSPDRRDDKYLFMLLPVLLLLGAQGMAVIGNWLLVISSQKSVVSSQGSAAGRPFEANTLRNTFYVLRSTFYVLALLTIVLLTKPALDSLLANTGDDYDTAFAYVQSHWQGGDTVLTGTPTAAALYLGRNDFYSVQRRGGYDYRLLSVNNQVVDRWLGSPAIRSAEALHQTLAGQPVWLVLERWGLQSEYYDLLFQQQLLAQTDLITEVEAQGIFVLRSKPNPQPLALDPAQPVTATLGEQVQLLGYTLEPAQPSPGQPVRLTLYWQALTAMPHDYTVFVHLRQPGGGNVAQADHRPLDSIYPTTLWPVGETIRESSDLFVPADLALGDYELWVGMYLLETGERLPVRDDTSGENAVPLGRVTIR